MKVNIIKNDINGVGGGLENDDDCGNCADED